MVPEWGQGKMGEWASAPHSAVYICFRLMMGQSLSVFLMGCFLE